MPSKSPAQANLMRAVAHGWKPDRIKGPSRAVAREFVNADRKYSGGFAENRYWTGGLAAMNNVNSMNGKMNYQAGGYYPGNLYNYNWGDYGGGTLTGPTTAPAPAPTPAWEAPGGWQYGTEPLSYEEAMGMDDLSGVANMMGPLVNFQQQGWTQVKDPDNPEDLRASMWYPPGSTAMGGVESTILDPGDPTVGGTPDRIIPTDPATLVGGSPFGSDVRPPNMVGGAPTLTSAEQTAASRQSPYRDQLRAHKARVVAALNPGPRPPTVVGGGNMMSGQMVPPGAIGGDLQNPIYAARGGHMNYQEGGTARRKPVGNLAPIPGHMEGQNPNRPGTALYRHWENTFHIEPPPPPPPPEPEEEPGWWESLFSSEEARQTRTEKELEALGEARGGHVRRYQVGGLAQAAPGPGQFRPPAGGVPPSMRGLPPRAGGIPPRMEPPRAGGTVLGQPLPTGPAPGGGIPGGPRVPPNQRGYLQRQRMMNRPPPNVGGGVNRVGMQDQQGGLARALQRGTGRPPMSRRAGFPGR